MQPLRVTQSNIFLTQWNKCVLAEQFPRYTAYLQCLANDARAAAFTDHLRPLIVELLALDHSTRWLFIDSIFREISHRRYQQESYLSIGMPYDLVKKIAIPTLLEQRHLQPNDSYVYVWLATLSSTECAADLPNSSELLEHAHQLDPLNQFIALRLADEWLFGIEYDCHHLPSWLFDSSENLLKRIDKLRKLASAIDDEQAHFFTEQTDWYEQKIKSFLAQAAAS